MKLFAYFLAALLAIPLLAQEPGPSVEKPFVSGGRVSLDLEAGDYTIKPADTNIVRVSWNRTSYEGKEKVHVTVDTSGSNATVRVEDTPHNNFHAIVEVPRACDLFVRLTAGDLNIAPITGSKDIESRAGDMNIQIAEPNDYGHVDASVVAGDLNATAFHGSKSGLFRSFDWSGPGKHSLHVHLWAGDLNLRPALPSTSTPR